MAQRPVWYYSKQDRYISTNNIEFFWRAGTSPSQKKRNIQELHNQVRQLRSDLNPLEVSTKSDDPLGYKLSAFNLQLNGHILETTFHAGKVFRDAGPFLDLKNQKPWEAKNDSRLKTSGPLTHFEWEGQRIELATKTLFYDWIYFLACKETLSPAEWKRLKEFNIFSDIEFNPKRSLNTQARAVVLVQHLNHTHQIHAVTTLEQFQEIHQQKMVYNP